MNLNSIRHPLKIKLSSPFPVPKSESKMIPLDKFKQGGLFGHSDVSM